MPRPPKFSNEQVLDHCLRLSNQKGIQSLTVSAVARSLAAPSGSIYHRFASRDLLVASLWLRSIQRFQIGLFEALDNPDPTAAARAAARHTITWSRDNLEDAQFLLVHRRQDLLADGWPPEIQERSALQEETAKQKMAELCQALEATGKQTERVHFAVVVIPLGAVRPFLSRGVAPDAHTELLALEAVEAILAPFSPSRSQTGDPL